MAEVVWSEPALADLEAIADFIALQDPLAARGLVRRVYDHVAQLADHPESGSRPRELGKGGRYRQIVEPPCRIFYRLDGTRIVIVHVMRTERLLRRSVLKRLRPRP
ncbi:MAG TPA: type II toxin-antitoxin system RelE/ParE family toxin [Thiobacillus sp.]